jgi:hypothetical protein
MLPSSSRAPRRLAALCNPEVTVRNLFLQHTFDAELLESWCAFPYQLAALLNLSARLPLRSRSLGEALVSSFGPMRLNAAGMLLWGRKGAGGPKHF